MAIELKNYDPAVMQGANIGVSVDLTDITDNNGNEVIEIDGVTSAVNYVRVTNAATSAGPTISAQGDDTNIALTINSLLTGALTLDSTSTGAVNIGNSANAKTITIGNTTGATAVNISAGTGNINLLAATTSKRQVLASSGNTTMTSAMSGSVMLIDGATVAYTLPAIGAGDVGMHFWFFTTVASTAATITAGAADLLTGGVIAQSTTAGGAGAFSPDVTDDLIITQNGTTTGGVIGSTWYLVAVSATRWYCIGNTIGSGTLATPFS